MTLTDSANRPDRSIDPPHYQYPGITLPRWLYGHATCHQIVVLGALIHHLPDVRPSHARIAGLAGISVASVKRTIAELVERGWLVIERRFRPDGGQLSSRYLILLDPVDPLPPVTTPHRQEMPIPPSSQGATPRSSGGTRSSETGSQGATPPSSQGATNRDISNTLKDSSIALRQEEEPRKETPVVPKKPKGEKLTLTRDQLPEELAPVADLLIDWWNHHKDGKRTQLALTGQISQLRKILEASDATTLGQQIQQGIDSSAVGGRRWAGITYANFAQYRAPAKSRFPNPEPPKLPELVIHVPGPEPAWLKNYRPDHP